MVSYVLRLRLYSSIVFYLRLFHTSFFIMYQLHAQTSSVLLFLIPSFADYSSLIPMSILLRSIEDPFEAWYDVAHVIKSFQMTFIRKEFLRAHTIVTRCLSQIGLQSSNPQNPSDSLPGVHDVLPEHLLTALCEPTEPPSFTSTAKAERALRKNTIELMGDTDDMDL